MSKKTYIPLEDVVLWEGTKDVRDGDRSNEIIRSYSENLDNLSPILLDQHNRILDGFHRYFAHELAGEDKIPYTVKEVESDAHAVEIAIVSNAVHGVPLTVAEIRRNAIRLFKMGRTNKDIAKIVKRHETVVGKYVKATRERMESELCTKLGELYAITDDSGRKIYTHTSLAEEFGFSTHRVKDLIDKHYLKQIIDLYVKNGARAYTAEILAIELNANIMRIAKILEKNEEAIAETLTPEPAQEPEPELEVQLESESGNESDEITEEVFEAESTAEPEAKEHAEAESDVGEDDEEKDEESKRIHSEMQWMLLWLGNELNLNLRLPKTDLTQSHKKNEIVNLAGKLKELPFDILMAGRSVQRIDVLWLKDNKIIAAFEIEHSTGIESGLFRMSHLWVSLEDLSIRTYIVAPDTDVYKAQDKISEPTFKHNRLAESCWFVPYTKLANKYNEAEQNGSVSKDWQGLLDEIGYKL